MEERQSLTFPWKGSLLDGAEYIPSAQTDVQKTWRKFGWVPPSESKEKTDVQDHAAK